MYMYWEGMYLEAYVCSFIVEGVTNYTISN